jgi:hypothetical protein
MTEWQEFQKAFIGNTDHWFGVLGVMVTVIAAGVYIALSEKRKNK